MRCEQCGGAVDEHQSYCGTCGVALEPAPGQVWYVDNQDDETALYEQVAERDYQAQQRLARESPPLPPEDDPDYPDPFPAAAPAERHRRPGLIAVVAGIVVITGLITAAVIVLKGRTSTAADPTGTAGSATATTSTAPDPASSSAATTSNPAAATLPPGADDTGWTDSPDLQCTGGQGAVFLLQTETARVTICGAADGSDLSYHGLKRTTGDTIVLDATFQAGQYVAGEGTTYTVGTAGLTIADSTGVVLDEPAEVVWTP